MQWEGHSWCQQLAGSPPKQVNQLRVGSAEWETMRRGWQIRHGRGTGSTSMCHDRTVILGLTRLYRSTISLMQVQIDPLWLLRFTAYSLNQGKISRQKSPLGCSIPCAGTTTPPHGICVRLSSHSNIVTYKIEASTCRVTNKELHLHAYSKIALMKASFHSTI